MVNGGVGLVNGVIEERNVCKGLWLCLYKSVQCYIG